MSSVVGMEQEFERLLFEALLKEYRWEIALAKSHGVSIWVIDALRKLIEKAPFLTNEGDRFSFAMVLLRPGENLPAAPIKVPPFHLSQTGRISNLKSSAAGTTACYQINELGMMSIVEIPVRDRRASADETMMELSKKTDSLAVYVGIDIARIYSSGKVIRTFRKGVWIETHEVDFKGLVGEGYPKHILDRIMQLCVNLSEDEKAGTIVVQKGSEIISCKPFRQIDFTECDLGDLSQNQLQSYAEMDGAVIVTVDGRVLGISQMLIYPAWDTGSSGGGARHESANRYSAHHECVIFVVSSDGPVSIFKMGSLWVKCFSELNP